MFGLWQARQLAADSQLLVPNFPQALPVAADMDIARKIGSVALDFFMVAGVVWPYIPQARVIMQTKNTQGFSLMTSLVVILSGTLRCFFWLGRHFDNTLLVQAIVSVITQMVMVVIIVRINGQARAPGDKRPLKTLSDLEISSFWVWEDVNSYLHFEFIFIMFLLMLQVAFGSFGWFVEVLGTLALGIEALLPVPQAVRNFRNKSTAGLSSVLVISWLVGDAIKTVWAFSKDAPTQFLLCGMFQLSVDIILFIQLVVSAIQVSNAICESTMRYCRKAPALCRTRSCPVSHRFSRCIPHCSSSTLSASRGNRMLRAPSCRLC